MFGRAQTHLQWLASGGGEDQTRTITQFHIFGEEDGLEVLGMSRSSANTHHLI